MWRLFIIHREECYTILFPVIPQEQVRIGPMHAYGLSPREMARRLCTSPSPIARAVWRNIYPRAYRYVIMSRFTPHVFRRRQIAPPSSLMRQSGH